MFRAARRATLSRTSVVPSIVGGDVVRAPRLMHGKTSLVQHDGAGPDAVAVPPLELDREQQKPRVALLHGLVGERAQAGR